jgi:serine/threonine-protein kinase
MYKAPVPPRAVPECPPDLPPGLEVIIMRCLRKKPEERYQTMEELELDLERLMRGEVPKAASDMMALSGGFQSIAQSAMAAAAMPGPIPGAPSERSPNRSRMPVVAAISAIVAVGAIGAFSMLGNTSKTHAGAAPSDVAPTKSAATDDKAKSPVVAASASAEPEKKARTIMIDAGGVAGAKVYDGDKLLAEAPTNLELASGSSRAVTVKAPGFVDKTITIDDASPTKVEVTLARVTVVGPAPIKSTGTTGKKKGSGDVDDPWAK